MYDPSDNKMSKMLREWKREKFAFVFLFVMVYVSIFKPPKTVGERSNEFRLRTARRRWAMDQANVYCFHCSGIEMISNTRKIAHNIAVLWTALACYGILAKPSEKDCLEPWIAAILRMLSLGFKSLYYL